MTFPSILISRPQFWCSYKSSICGARLYLTEFFMYMHRMRNASTNVSRCWDILRLAWLATFRGYQSVLSTAMPGSTRVRETLLVWWTGWKILTLQQMELIHVPTTRNVSPSRRCMVVVRGYAIECGAVLSIMRPTLPTAQWCVSIHRNLIQTFNWHSQVEHQLWSCSPPCCYCGLA